MRLDDVVPRPDHVTRQARWIAADPGTVWEALHAVRLSGLPVTVALSAARFLPVVLSGRGLGQLHDRPFLDALPVPLLASEPPSSVVFGGLLQAWRLGGGERGPSSTPRGCAGGAPRAGSRRRWTSGSSRAAAAPSSRPRPA